MGLYSTYDSEHRHPVNRALHMLAIPIGFAAPVVCLFFWTWTGLLLVPLAFAQAWTGHLIEGNQPATATKPVLVLVAPLWMARKVLGCDKSRGA